MVARKIRHVVCGLLLSALLAGCGSGASVGFPKGPIKLGVVTSLTGSKAAFGQAQRNGYELALEEINAAGGVAGHPLELIYADDKGDPEQAILAAEQLITQDQVPLFLGSYSSECTFAMAGAIEGYQTPLISPCAATDALTQQGYGWIFRINAPSSQYSETMFDFLSQVADLKTVAILFESTDFGTSTARAAKELAEAHGFQVVAYEPYNAQSPDFRPLLTIVKKVQPDVLFAVSYLDDAVLLMQQSHEIDFNPRLFAGYAAGFALPAFIERAGTDAENVVSVSQWTPDVSWPGAQEFAHKYQERYNEVPGLHAAETYAALFLAADVLERASSLDKEKIRAALSATDLDQSIFGPISFDQTGQNTHRMVVTQVQAGQFVTIYPAKYAAAELVYPVSSWSDR
jgi:branched-chain amino acid transport system substrate-binding protein